MMTDSQQNNFLKTLHTRCMESFLLYEKVKQYITIVFGALIMATAVVMFFDASGVVVGGVTGVSIILKEVAGVPMWIVTAGVNIPLFIAGYKILDRDVFGRTLVGTVALTIFLGILPKFNLLTGDLLVDIIIGSVLMGSGLGFIFTSYASSGGTDLLATLIGVKIRHISIPKIMAAIDGVIVAGGATVFGIKKGIYALIAVYIVTKVSDSIMEGPNRAKLIYIVSNESEAVGKYIVNNVKRGVTYLHATGAFTNSRKNVIMCVVSSKEMVKIKQNLYQIDENAICFVGDIREAFGEGFTKYRG